MAKHRYLDTKFWDDSYIVKLDPTEKLLFLYFLTNPLTSIAGIYEISLKRIAFDTGIDQEMISTILKRLEKDKRVFYTEGWLIITNFPKYQDSQNPKIQQGIKAILDNLPQKVRYAIDMLSIPYIYPSNYLNPNPNLNSNLTKSNIILHSEETSQGKEINNLINLFKPINPSYERLFKNKTQRSALERLVKAHGLEKITSTIEKLPELVNQKYAPRITTPLALEEKLGELIIFFNQHKPKLPSITKIR